MTGYNITERYFCRDKYGLHIFFIEVTIIHDPVQIIFLKSSLTRDLLELPCGSLIKLIESEFNSPERRMALIALLFIQIKQLPGISSEYFPDYYLNWDGCYCEPAHNTIQNLLSDKDFPDYSVFSNKINSVYFLEVKRHLESVVFTKDRLYVCKSLFEELLIHSYILQSEYAEQFATNADFYIIEKSNDGISYEFYIMAVLNEIKLFFIRRSL